MSLSGTNDVESDALFLYGKTQNKFLTINSNNEVVPSDTDITDLTNYYTKLETDNKFAPLISPIIQELTADGITTTIQSNNTILNTVTTLPLLTGSRILTLNSQNAIINSQYTESTLPVSTPQQTALNLKSNIDNPTFTTKITTPVITLNGTQTASKILKLDATKNVISSAYDETTLPVSIPQQTALDLKANLANPTFTGTVTSPAINVSGQTASRIVTLDASKNITSSAYTESTLPVSTPQQTALNLKANIDNPAFTTKITTPVITLNGTQIASKLLLTDASKNIVSSLYTDSDFPRLTASNAFTGTTNTFNFLNINPTYVLTTQGIRPQSASSDFSIGGNSTSGVFTIGHNNPASDTGTIVLNRSTSLGTNKNLTLQGTGKITTPNILVSGLTASKLVLTDALKNIISSTYDETTLPVSTPTQSAINLKANLASPSFTGNITMLGDTFVGQYSPTIDKALYCKFYSPLNAGDAVYFSLFQTSGSTYLCDSITGGSINIGNSQTPSNHTGAITLYGNTVLTSGKNLTLSGQTASKLVKFDASKNIVSSTYDETTLPVSTPQQTALNLKADLTTSALTNYTTTTNLNTALNLKANLTTSALTNYTTTTNLNTALNLKANLASPTFTGVVTTPSLQPVSASSTINLSTTTTTGVVNLATSITSGSINIGNTSSQVTNVVIGGRTKIQGGSSGSAYFNSGTGTSSTLFQSAVLNNKYIPEIFTGAGAQTWTVFESDAYNGGGDASFFAQNGTTSIICNPADNQALWWLDEDVMVTNGTTVIGFANYSYWSLSTGAYFTVASDERGKRDIRPLDTTGDDILSRLQKVNLKKFKKKRPEGVTRETKKYDEEMGGYIAQDILQAGFDDMVVTNDDGYLAVKYSEMNFYWYKGIQQLIKQNKQQQRQIDDLQQRLQILETGNLENVSQNSVSYTTELEVRLSRVEQLLQENLTNSFYAK